MSTLRKQQSRDALPVAAAVDSPADVVPVVVHPQNSSVDGEERPVEAQSHGAVEILPLLFGHLKNDLCGVFDASALKHTHTRLGIRRVRNMWRRRSEAGREGRAFTYRLMLLIRMSISSFDHMPCFHL